MKFKVFTANTIQEAMAQVKSELGMDAVILHTRRFNKGGIFGYLGKEMVEVMAAIDDKQQEKVKLPKEEFKELLTEKAKIVETTPPPVVASHRESSRSLCAVTCVSWVSSFLPPFSSCFYCSIGTDRLVWTEAEDFCDIVWKNIIFAFQILFLWIFFRPPL